MISVMEFGIRRVPPCSDCWENGQCSMNCGPAVRSEDGRLDASQDAIRVGNRRRSGVRRSDGDKRVLDR